MLINVQCSKCNQSFSVDEKVAHALCPNPNCTALVHFAFFDDYESAVTYQTQHKQWYGASLTQEADRKKWIVAFFREPIYHYTLSTLSELLSKDVLQSIQAGFADYLGGPFTLFQVSEGSEHQRIEPLRRKSNADVGPSKQDSKFRNFTRFCETVRTHVSNGKLLGDTECHNTDCRVIDEILSSGRSDPSSHFCWCGLVDFTAPIKLDGKTLGVIFTGQTRHKDHSKQDIMKDSIEKAGRYLGIDKQTLIDLAYGNDVEEVDDDEVSARKKELGRIASQVQVFAAKVYQSQRQIREQEFLDSIEDVFTEAIGMIGPDPLSIKPLLDTVLKGIRLFTSFPLAGLFLSVGDQKDSLEYIAGNLWSESTEPQQILVDTSLFRIGELKLAGPAIGVSSSCWPLSANSQLSELAGGFRGGDASATCLVPITSSGCEGCLMLTAPRSQQTTIPGFDYVDSELGRKFLRNAGHTVAKHIGVCLDIARIKRDRANFRHLMISLAHEINTPIQSMLADAANIRAEIHADTEVRNIAEHNLDEVKCLHLLTENILEVLSEEGKPEVPFSSHSIYRPLREACEMFAGEATAKGCDIVGPRSVGTQFPKIKMHLFELTLAFKNLVHNAVKYSFYPPQGMEGKRFIEVTGRWQHGEENKKYIVEITNYGVGIKPEEIEKGLIFHPFYRGEYATDRYRTGSGLGLTLVKHVIVDMHGGAIQVQSVQVPGTAYVTVFTVILPISRDDK